MTTYIALLRGINVGGNNLVSMADLRALLGEMGLENVKTLLQSGNVVFQCPQKESEKLEVELATALHERAGLKIGMFVRTTEQWAKVIAENPFLEAAVSDPSHLVVIFLRDTVDHGKVDEVRSLVQGPETLQAVGDRLYVVYPDGIGPSTLPRTPGWNKLASQGTARNWNTVLKLAALAEGLG